MADLNRELSGMAQFQKGESGNPLGRPRGIQDRRVALRAVLEGKAEELLAKAVEKALEGDTAVLIALLSRLIPSLRSEVSPLTQPVDGSSPSEQAGKLVSAALSGNISSATATELLQALLFAVKVNEADELVARIQALEAKSLARA